MKQLLELMRSAKVYDLGQPYFVGMPHHPSHPPFLYSLSKKHGDMISPAGSSSAAEAITLGGHVGTHIDAFCHFSCGGELHGGIAAAPVQSYGGGLQEYSIDTLQPIVRRAILLDIAALESDGELPEDFVILPEHMERACTAHGVSPEPGDVVLLRTGWARYWEDPQKYLRTARGGTVHGPGPAIDAARWLSARKIFATGADTVAYEHVPAPDMPVHVHLLVESGIHLIECLNLEELAHDGVHEFLFVGSPLKIRGGTGAPIRPVAVVSS